MLLLAKINSTFNIQHSEVILLTAIEYRSVGDNGEKTINHHGKMRKIKVGNVEEQDNQDDDSSNAWEEEIEDCMFSYLMPRLKTIRKCKRHLCLKMKLSLPRNVDLARTCHVCCDSLCVCCNPLLLGILL